jgi:hypothetical protein
MLLIQRAQADDGTRTYTWTAALRNGAPLSHGSLVDMDVDVDKILGCHIMILSLGRYTLT